MSSVFISDVSIVMQHTRLDSCQAGNAWLSTIAFAGYQYARNKWFLFTTYFDAGTRFYYEGGAAGGVSL